MYIFIYEVRATNQYIVIKRSRNLIKHSCSDAIRLVSIIMYWCNDKESMDIAARCILYLRANIIGNVLITFQSLEGDESNNLGEEDKSTTPSLYLRKYTTALKLIYWRLRSHLNINNVMISVITTQSYFMRTLNKNKPEVSSCL